MKIIRHPQKLHGFTLIEIIAVLAIFGLLTLISLPVYKQIKPNLTLNAEARDLVSNLKYAQQLSVTEQVNYAVVFNQALNQYAIINNVTGATVKTKILNNLISIQSIDDLTDNKAVFNVTGAAVENGSVIITNINNSTFTISIKPSGYVKIE